MIFIIKWEKHCNPYLLFTRVQYRLMITFHFINLMKTSVSSIVSFSNKDVLHRKDLHWYGEQTWCMMWCTMWNESLYNNEQIQEYITTMDIMHQYILIYIFWYQKHDNPFTHDWIIMPLARLDLRRINVLVSVVRLPFQNELFPTSSIGYVCWNSLFLNLPAIRLVWKLTNSCV